MLFDSHTHLTHDLFDNDREEIIKKLRDLGIGAISVGNGLEDAGKAIDLAKKYPNQIWASVGIHPDDVAKITFNWNELEFLARDSHIIAIGECGLDYYRNLEDQNLQKEIFIKQIKLAQELKKPLIIHCRSSVGTEDAYEDALEILKSKHFPPKADQPLAENISIRAGVVHFFSGSKAIARRFLDLGFHISFAGPITFASQYQEIVEYVPLDKTLIETDAPFAAPAPYRGRRNEPAYVEFVARRIAQWKGADFESVAKQTTENALRLYCLK